MSSTKRSLSPLPLTGVKKTTTASASGGVSVGEGSVPTHVKTKYAKGEPKAVVEITEEQRDELAERSSYLISQETQYIKDAKAEANTLLSQFRADPPPYTIPLRSETKTANVFPFYIGRLNPPHLFHLLSLFTAIFIARKHGTKALFLLGSGGKDIKNNPLDDKLKWEFINRKLSEFGFVKDTDYKIVHLGYANTNVHDFIDEEVRSSPPPPPQDITIVHIGGDKPEGKPNGQFVLDVDKFLKGDQFVLEGIPATYRQAVIVSGESSEKEAMSASHLRNTACTCLDQFPGDPDKAFGRWVSLFTPMYRDDRISRDIFDRIITVSCPKAAAGAGVAAAERGGSRRKHTIRKLRNRKTLRRRSSRRIRRSRGRGRRGTRRTPT